MRSYQQQIMKYNVKICNLARGIDSLLLSDSTSTFVIFVLASTHKEKVKLRLM